MRRVVVVGAGFFGRLVATRLRDVGIVPFVVTRRGGDARMDAEDAASIAALLRAGDVVVDTAGPFAARTTALLRTAVDRGCDVIDLSDSLAFAERVLALRDAIDRAGVHVYPGCSAVAAVTGACVVASGLVPVEVDQFLAPASAETASPATVRAFVTSLGLPIRVLRDGHIASVRGYTESRRFPGSERQGGLVESSAPALLRLSWPDLRRADLWVDPNMPLGHASLALAARVAPLAALARAVSPVVPASGLGRHDGVFAVSVRADGRERAFTLTAARRSYLIAVEPAVIVAETLARGATPERGIVAPHAQVEPHVLFARLRALGIDVRS